MGALILSWRRRIMRMHLRALGLLGVLAPFPMTALFLFLAIQANERRLAEHREARRELIQRSPMLAHADSERALARARSYPVGRLITNVALSTVRPDTLSYDGSVLSVGDDGRDMKLNGHSIDGMTRQELLRELHEFGERFENQRRP